jgi:hypothetical protein
MIAGAARVARPSRQGGRVAISDKKPRHVPTIYRLTLRCRAGHATRLFSTVEYAWRSFLSLRDPAGPPLIAAVPSHGAGPPDTWTCRVQAIDGHAPSGARLAHRRCLMARSAGRLDWTR